MAIEGGLIGIIQSQLLHWLHLFFTALNTKIVIEKIKGQFLHRSPCVSERELRLLYEIAQADSKLLLEAGGGGRRSSVERQQVLVMSE